MLPPARSMRARLARCRARVRRCARCACRWSPSLVSMQSARLQVGPRSVISESCRPGWELQTSRTPESDDRRVKSCGGPRKQTDTRLWPAARVHIVRGIPLYGCIHRIHVACAQSQLSHQPGDHTSISAGSWYCGCVQCGTAVSRISQFNNTSSVRCHLRHTSLRCSRVPDLALRLACCAVFVTGMLHM